MAMYEGVGFIERCDLKRFSHIFHIFSQYSISFIKKYESNQKDNFYSLFLKKNKIKVAMKTESLTIEDHKHHRKGGFHNEFYSFVLVCL